jgi:hypothetical protein
MANDWEIRGVPRALTCDMWWFAGEGPGPVVQGRRPLGSVSGTTRSAVALLGLVALADLLFYGHFPGLSLAVFAAAILGVAMILSPGRDRLRPALLLLASALPVVEHLQHMSLGFLLAGLLTSLAWTTGGANALGPRALRLLRDLPLRGAVDGFALARTAQQGASARDIHRHAKAWAFPVGGALILTALLVQANPILGDAFARMLQIKSDGTLLARGLFWVGAALVVWPMIASPRPVVAARPATLPQIPGPGPASVLRGLVLFNAILGLQTLMDAAYLWGGASLPSGMTAAEYAHRGAYPLLATALLAGAFALAARPFARENPWLRRLLLMWLAQNLLLTVSALLRLELYVEAFGLTYLRLYAAIWMGLVGAGLGLIGWQVWRDLPNRWLLVRSAGLGLATLYAACFVNFAAIIATQNLSRPDFADDGYICTLPATADAAIVASGRRPLRIDEYGDTYGACALDGPNIKGWRDWGFRKWRVRRYLDGVKEAAHEDPRGG